MNYLNTEYRQNNFYMQMMRYSFINLKTQLVSRAKTLKILSLVIMFTLPLSSYSQEQGTNDTKQTPERIELNYKQRYSRTIIENDNLYADGIKIKRDLTILKEIQEQRILSEDEIPAEELYGSIWVNNRVNAYTSVIKDAPDTFNVDLSNFTMPTLGHITSKFGKRGRRMHYGIDLKVQTGDTIYAAFEGKIRMRQYERRGYGYYVVVRHPNGLETVYGHLSKFLVEENTVVKSGDPIALGGNTGRSTGSHLHLEFRYLGKPINPVEIVDFDNKVCHKDTYLVTPQTFNVRGSKYANYANVKSATGNNKYSAGDVAYHRIKSGETLSTIARKYGTTIKELCRINNITSTTTLRAGKSIRIS